MGSASWPTQPAEKDPWLPLVLAVDFDIYTFADLAPLAGASSQQLPASSDYLY